MARGYQHTTARRAVTITAAVVAPLLSALAVLGGIGSFTTIRDLAQPWFGHLAWIIPIGVDLGILALLTWDLLAEYLSLSWPVLRWTAWAFIAATVYLNIAAAHGNPTAAIMHAAMPVLFITVIEGIRHLIRQLTGLATGIRIERIPLSRWLLAPRTTFLLGRRMILWHVTSYRDGLALEHEHLTAVSRLQERYGRWRWRWRAPLGERLALQLAPAAATVASDETAVETDAVTGTSRPRLAALPQSFDPLNERDTKLIYAAADIFRQADRQGIQLSQATLAKRIRARGLSIPNQRLGWLATAARAEARTIPEPANSLGRETRAG
jgi:Protein of unknown function (DUF2637)